jgi:spoIIIJ-associated protein
VREITATGLSVEEAVQSALKQLNANREEAEITILEEGKKGFLGLFGTKPAVVKAVKIPNPAEEARLFLIEVIRNMNVQAEVEMIQEGKNVTFQIEGDKVALLIGKRGQTLNSLQYLTQLVANRHSNHYLQITVDAENYRTRRKETLVQLAQKLAHQAVRTSKEVPLEPMPSYERKIIHAALVNQHRITTYSVGEEPNRHLVIAPKKQGKPLTK